MDRRTFLAFGLILLILLCALASTPGAAGEWDEKEWDE